MSSPDAVLAIDQGTTGSTAIVVSRDGRVLGRAYSEFTQHFPRPGWVEHDAGEIWEVTRRVARGAVDQSGEGRVAAIGITNQRETVVVWDRETLEPVGRAIVWQDRRTTELCRSLEAQGHGPLVREATGLVLDPYFSGTKLRWMLDQDAGLRRRADAGELAAGTIDAWLVARLTEGRVHATDHTNASRTLLYNLHTRTWDPALLDLFGVPHALLPEVVPSAHDLGPASGDAVGVEAPVAGLAGDQQAALFGQGCWHPGLAKNTYGTGAFLLLHTGNEPISSENGLLTTAACDARGGPAYALEGSVFIAGAAIQWLRDGLGLLEAAADSEAMARSVESTGGVVFVPAFVGLGAPHWEPDARGTVVGITRGTRREHLVRAALEAMAFGTAEVLEAMEADAGGTASELRVDGGASKNDWLMQFQADVLGIQVRRPAMVETTALGAAGLAGLACAVWDSGEEFLAALGESSVYAPRMTAEERGAHRREWGRAVDATRAWARSHRG
jgi:glycerol kinase